MSQEAVEVFSKDTFLTSLRNGSSHANETPVTRVNVEEPAAMAMVREKHAQLHEVVGSLSEKISAVLARQEKDFLAAYRAHMYNVQKELHDLREKMHRNDTAENKTEKIKKVEEERDWYRKEALRLDAFTTAMNKDLKYMREKLDSIEEDRNWLEKQLKACKKQNKLLRAELDVRVTSGAVTPFDSSTLPTFESPKASIGSLRKTSKRNVEGFDDIDPASTLPQLQPDYALSSLVEEREEKLKKQVRNLKKELNLKTHENTILKRQRAMINDDGARTQLENFFLQCIESVKDEVIRRKTSTLDKKSNGRSSNADRIRNQRQDVGSEVEDFSAADRVRVIERLLAHDEVLSLLYEQLFPTQSSANRERPATTDGDRRERQEMSASDSSKSLPETSPHPSRRESFEPTNSPRIGQPAGSGAAAASAVRGNGLPIDDSTRDYLRAMRTSQL